MILPLLNPVFETKFNGNNRYCTHWQYIKVRYPPKTKRFFIKNGKNTEGVQSPQMLDYS